jgi:ubiquinone/menaquinone biosynthesis C-methylase UbiE
MPDVYATITEADRSVQERLADVMEQRAVEPAYQAMVKSYLADIAFPPQARVLEIGCGTGSVTRVLAQWHGVDRVLGIDPSPVFIERARALASGLGNAEFRLADGRELPLDAESFDVVVLNTMLSHVPQPQRVVAEGCRVLRPGGWCAAFDGDYATATVARDEFDPLQTCVAAFRTSFVNDSWLGRRLPQLLSVGGFEVVRIGSHGYVEAPKGGYMLTWIDRGADVLVQRGCIGQEAADALKAEARRRSEESRWFGHIAFASVIARKPLSKA